MIKRQSFYKDIVDGNLKIILGLVGSDVFPKSRRKLSFLT